MTAASARCSTGMRFVLATVPLPTGVACPVTARARRSPRSAWLGWKARNLTTAPKKSSTYSAWTCSLRRVSASLRLAYPSVDRIRAELEAERSTEGYARRREADARRRDKAQAEYAEDFFGAVVAFLAFHANHAELADRLARAVTDHATPVGSGTVARTKRIPVERRAEAAVIAWMRHQTTGYDGMMIPRIKGKRREVRRMLARRSQEMLARYRRGEQDALDFDGHVVSPVSG